MVQKEKLDLLGLYKYAEIRIIKTLNLSITIPLLTVALILVKKYLPSIFFWIIFSIVLARLGIHIMTERFNSHRSIYSSGIETFYSIFDPVVVISILYFTGGLNSIFLPLALYNMLVAAFIYEDTNSNLVFFIYLLCYNFLAFSMHTGRLPHFPFKLNLFMSNSKVDLVIISAVILYSAIIILLFGRLFNKNIKNFLHNFESALHLISDIYLITPTGKTNIVFLQVKNEQKYGIKSEQIIGTPFAQYIHPDDLPNLLERKQIGEKSGIFEPITIRIILNNRIFFFRVFTAHLMFNYNISLLLDITEERRRKSTLEYYRRLITGVYLSGALLHELNNITTILKIEIPQISSGDSTKKRLREALKRQEQILHLFAEYSRRESSIRNPISIGAIIKQSIEFTELFQYDIAVSYKIFGIDQNCTVLGDPNQLSLAFNNILLNSIRAIRQRGNNGEIQIRLRAEDNMCYIHISDNGVGMSNAEINKLFDLGAISSPIKEKNCGMGIGLIVTRSIIQAHNGDITIKSKKDKGTEVIISLPSCTSQQPI